MKKKKYCVYILTNNIHTVFYTGVTSDLLRRMIEYKKKRGSTFTTKYNMEKLVYFECKNDAEMAIFREEQIHTSSRKEKMDLINAFNPEWNDLFDDLVAI